jgi:hypothetical protein
MVKVPYEPVRDHQYVWFKSEFNVEKDPSHYYGIVPGVIYHVDTVYLNGQFIGEHSSDESHNINFPRHYRLPGDVLVKGKNTILIRTGIYGREYGGLPGEIQVLSRNDYFNARILNDLIYRHIPIGIVILLVGQVIFHILFYLWRRNDPVNIYGAVIYMIWITYILMLFSPFHAISEDVRITFLWSCISLVPIFFILFLQAYYRVYISFSTG